MTEYKNEPSETEIHGLLRSSRNWTKGFASAGMIYALAFLIPAGLLDRLDASFAVRNFAGATLGFVLAVLAYSYRRKTIAGTIQRSTASCLIGLSLLFSVLMALLWVGEILSS